MKVHALMENTSCSPEIKCAHGLSLFIESQGQKILFDSGPDGSFADNAERMGLRLEEIDFAFLSHGHYDHGGGLSRFMELNAGAPVYISPTAFGDYHNAAQKYIGLDRSLKDNPRFIKLCEPLEIGNAVLYPCFTELEYPLDRAGLSMGSSEGLIPDSFLHEQYLLIEEEGKRILFSGCSHRGILNIMSHFRPDILIGGFHFMKQEIGAEGNALLDNAAEILSGYDTLYYTCHCTGLKQYEYLKARMGERLHYLSAGESIEI